MQVSSALRRSSAKAFSGYIFLVFLGLSGGVRDLHHNEPCNVERLQAWMPFQGLGVAKWKTATHGASRNPKQIKVIPFPLLTPSDVKSQPLFFFSSFFSLGFVSELFHAFPVELLLLLAYSDKMVTHDDSNLEKFQSVIGQTFPQHGQNPQTGSGLCLCCWARTCAKCELL